MNPTSSGAIDANKFGDENVSITYERYGDPNDPTLLLIAGLGSQLVTWEDGFLQLFLDEHLSVVVFDNRDIGKSSFFDEYGKPDLVKAREDALAPYDLWDMAADTAGLIDGLQLDRVHVMGVSMGGMIGQCLASAQQDRVASLASIMSTTGNSKVGQSSDSAGKMLVRSAPTDKEEFLDATWQRFQTTGFSPGFPVTEDYVRGRALRAYERGYHPDGNARQLAAVFASGDRTDSLAKITAPTVVIHGSDDVLLDLSGGEATAAAIKNAQFVVVEGMGHHLPPGSWPQVADAVLSNIARAN